MKKKLTFVLIILLPYFIHAQHCVRDTSLYDFQYLNPDFFGWTAVVEETHIGYMRSQSLYKEARSVDCQQDGKMVAVSAETENQIYLTRYEENGKVDTSFANGGNFILNTLLPSFAKFYGLKIYQNNIYIALSDAGNLSNSTSTNYLIGLDINGNPLNSFGNNGVVHLDTTLHKVAYTSMNIDANGNIFLAGGQTSGNIYITQLAATTGNEISSFGNNGVGLISTVNLPTIKSILIDNGAVLVSGAYYNSNGSNVVAKFLANGTADLSFNGTGYKAFKHPTYGQGDQSNIHKAQNGNYILTGSLWDDNTWRKMVYALEFDSQGVINSSYGNNGWFINDIGIIANKSAVKSFLLDDDRLIISSMKALHQTVSTMDSSKIAIFMLKPDGTLDNSFAPGGILYDQIPFRNYSAFMGEHRIYDLTVDKKGRLIIAGHGYDCNHNFCGQDGFIARYIFQETTTTSVAENPEDINVSLYPNPTTGKVTIDLGKVFTNVNIILKNNLGQEISTQQSESTDYINFEIDATAGIYFLTIKSNNGFMKTIKVIKQ